MRHVHANLVRAAGFQLGLDPRVFIETFDEIEHRVRCQPVFLHPHPPFAVG